MPVQEAPKNQELKLREQMQRSFDHMVTKGGVVRELRGISKDQMEVLYAMAYKLYQAANYLNAEHLFRLLCFYDHLEKKFWLGFGATYQMQKKYTQAITAYSFATFLDFHDPNPPFYAAECHVALGNKPAAEAALTTAIMFAGEQPEYKEIRKKAEALLGLLKTRVTKQGNN